MSSSEISQLSPILNPPALRLLAELDDTVDYGTLDPLKFSQQLRADGHSPELVSALLTQLRLRAKARSKFGPFTSHMVLTEHGVEQASRMTVAARHAQRFRAAGVEQVVDLGCGLGADSMAMATLDLTVTAVEIDELTSAAATINLLPFDTATVVNASAEDYLANNPADPQTGYWLDPARRVVDSSGSTRIFDPEAFSPPLSFVERLADAGVPVGVKLGPGVPHEGIPATAEAQWISENGSVVELALWFNSLARENLRRCATIITEHGTAELTSSRDFGDSPTVSIAGADGLQGYLYEPDGAVIRAGLVADLIDQEFSQAGGRLLDEHIAYFATDQPVHTPFATGYRVQEVLKYNVKNLRNWLRAHGVRRLDIKKRGVDVSPEELRRTLMQGIGKKSATEKVIEHVTLVLTRIGDERFAIVVQPIEV